MKLYLHTPPVLLPRLHPVASRNVNEQSSVSTRASHARALTNMGRLLEHRGSPDEALLCFREASSVDTGSAEALCYRAGNLQRRGDLDGAAFYFEGVG